MKDERNLLRVPTGSIPYTRTLRVAKPSRLFCRRVRRSRVSHAATTSRAVRTKTGYRNRAETTSRVRIRSTFRAKMSCRFKKWYCAINESLRRVNSPLCFRINTNDHGIRLAEYNYN